MVMGTRGWDFTSHLGVLTAETHPIGVGKTLFHVDGIDENKLATFIEKRICRELIGDSGKESGSSALYGCGNSTRNLMHVVSIGAQNFSGGAAISKVVKSTAIFRIPEPIGQTRIGYQEL